MISCEKQRVQPYPQLSMKSSLFHEYENEIFMPESAASADVEYRTAGRESGNTGKEGVREAGGETAEGG